MRNLIQWIPKIKKYYYNDTILTCPYLPDFLLATSLPSPYPCKIENAISISESKKQTNRALRYFSIKKISNKWIINNASRPLEDPTKDTQELKMEIWNHGLPACGLSSKVQKHMGIFSSIYMSLLILQDSVHFISIMLHFRGALSLFSSPWPYLLISYIPQNLEISCGLPQSYTWENRNIGEESWGLSSHLPLTYYGHICPLKQTDPRRGKDAYYVSQMCIWKKKKKNHEHS